MSLCNTTINQAIRSQQPVQKNRSSSPPEFSDDDPFACFGESDSDDDDSCSNHSSNHRSNHSSNHNATRDATNLELGRRLRNENELRQQNSLLEHLPVQSPNFEVYNDDRLSRGRSVRAKVSFVEGQEILREAAAMRVPGKQKASTQKEAEQRFASLVQLEFDKLSPKTAQAVMDLSSCKEDPKEDYPALTQKTPLGIYQTNAFQLGTEVDGGLFLTISRINHSCRPNVNHIWRPDLQMTLILATRDIQAGEEICTSYGPSQCLDTNGRRKYLREKYSFECDCDMCREGNDSGGDDRMLEINALLEDVTLYMALDDSVAAIHAVERGLLLLDRQGLGMGAYKKALLHKGYQISRRRNDTKTAHRYLARELLAVTNSEGIGSYRAIGIEREMISCTNS